jgi:transmembrane sensor
VSFSSSSDSTARDEAIEATAAAWLAERDSGLSAEDAAAFAAWRAADRRHEAAVARLESAWGAMQALREFRPAARVHPDRDLLARPSGGAVVPFPALAATAALAACVTLVAAWFWLRPTPAVTAASHVQYATTSGGYQRMTLPDGSIVDLNANTELREQFTGPQRRVVLVRGEATFQVTKNPARPFIVEADGVAVQAVGTAFNVRLRPGKVDVLVTEGRVRVDPPEKAQPFVAAVPELTMGQRVTLPTASAVEFAPPVVQTVSPAIVREELAWQEPKIVFVETPLTEVVRQFNARNRVQIELGDPSLATLPVGGSFRPDNVEGFVRLITSNEQIEAVRGSGDRIILRRVR